MNNRKASFTALIQVYATVMFFCMTGIVTGRDSLAELQTPSGLRAIAKSHSSILISWSDPSFGAYDFELERREGNEAFAKIADVPAGLAYYLDEDLETGLAYTYRIRSVQSSLFSPYSENVFYFLPSPVSFIPDEIKFLQLRNLSHHPIERIFSWNSFNVEDEYDVFQAPPCLSGEYYIGFQLLYDLGDFDTDASWEADLEISFMREEESLWTKPISLKSDSQTYVGTIFHDFPISCEGEDSYFFKIAAKSGTGSIPGSRITLKEFFFKKRIEQNEVEDLVELELSYEDGLLAFSWESYSEEFEFDGYELEWVFEEIDLVNHEIGGFDSGPEPVRVLVGETFYSQHIPLKDGHVTARVRGIVDNTFFGGGILKGEWLYSNDNLEVVNPSGEINWQSRISYAEQGKSQTRLNYFDGTLRPRQQLTNLSSENLTLVGETFYDFEGRSVLQVLPSPSDDPSLFFRSEFNEFETEVPEVASGTSATRIKFHYDNGRLEGSKLSNLTGTGNYYSQANTGTFLHRDLIPEALGYGYSQVEFTNDGTGRISRQSGVGEGFRIDGAHTTRYYYAQASAPELFRLFGSNVGNISHYKKNMVVDPNGQVSIQYLDQEGRTIATALGGDKPENVEGLPSYSIHENATQSQTASAFENGGSPMDRESQGSKLGDENEKSTQKGSEDFHQHWGDEMIMYQGREYYPWEVTEMLERKTEESTLSNSQSGKGEGILGGGGYQTLSSPLANQAEYDALMALYASTNGSAWTNKQGWSTADPNVLQSVVGWYGVTTNSSGRVTTLVLSKNNLVGTIPEEVGDLSLVTTLNLSENTLGGTIPATVGNMSSLKYLYLQLNSLTGGIPPEIGQATSIIRINVSRNLLTAALPSELGNLTAMDQLIINHNNFSGSIPASLGNLVNLTRLYIYNTTISGAIPAELGNLVKLERMYFNANAFSGSIPSSLGNLTKLTNLYLENNNLTGSIPQELGRLINMEYFSANRNSLSGPIPDSLGNMTRLIDIRLDRNNLTGSIPKSFGNFPDLIMLSLYDNQLSGELPDELGNLSNLTNLSICTNQYGGRIPASFGNLTKLIHLEIDNSNLVGEIPESFANLSQLQTLFLNNNQLEGKIPPGLADIRSLKNVYLHYNQLTGTIPANFGSATQLLIFYVYQNQLSGAIPFVPGSMLPAFILRVSHNKYTMGDLIPVAPLFTATSHYSAQKLIDVPKIVKEYSGNGFSLKATVDRETNPPSEYKWYKNGADLNSWGLNSHTRNFASLGANDEAVYHYRVRNSTLASLNLVSEPVTLSLMEPGWETITVDIGSEVEVGTNFRKHSKRFLNSSPQTPYSFDYSLSIEGVSPGVFGCLDCNFELEMQLLDPDGRAVELPEIYGNMSATNDSYWVTFTFDECQSEDLPNQSVELILEEIGDYTFTKTLRVLEKSILEIQEEVNGSQTFIDEVEELRTQYSITAENCEVCLDDCPEAELAIQEAIQQSVLMGCENILQRIIEEIAESEGISIGAVEQDDIENHPDYCHYQICQTDAGADIFEIEVSRIVDWGTATTLGVSLLIDQDPFYNEPQYSGFNYKADMQAALADVRFGSLPYDTDLDGEPDGYDEVRGPLASILDPQNTDYYVDPWGLRDPTGKHFLYYDLFGKRQEIGDEAFFQQLSEQRWLFYRSFYFQTSRRVKLEIDEFASCSPYMTYLEQITNIPMDESEVEQWMQQYSTDISNPNDEVPFETVNNTISLLQFNCNVEFSQTDSVELASYFEAYFNGNRNGNPFGLILSEDLGEGDLNLQAIEDLLGDYSCGLAQIAVANPLVCLRDTVIYMPYKEGIGRFGQEQTGMKAPQAGVDSLPTLGNPEFYQETLNKTRQKVEEMARANWEKSLPEDLRQTQSNQRGSSMMSPMSSSFVPSASVYQALMDLYQATDGDNWHDNTGWATANPNVPEDISGWYGLENDGFVLYEIWLDNNNLVGNIPSSIGNFTLGGLVLSNNALSGSLPTSIGNLTELVYLNLAGNSLSGSIPSSIGNLSNMVVCHLHQNQFTGSIPSSIGNLDAIATLTIDNNSLTGSIPGSVGKLQNLINLSLTYNQLSGSIPDSLTLATNLVMFHASYNQLTGSIPSNIGNLTQLAGLGLVSNQLTGGIPTSIGNCSNLEHLYLVGNNLNVALPSQLNSLTKLKWFLIGDNQIPGALPNLGNLVDLEYLYVYNNSFQGNLPSSIGNLQTLREFVAYANGFSGALPSTLSNMESLERFHVGWNNFSGGIPEDFMCQNQSITEIRLNNNTGLLGTIPECWGSTLGTLDVSFCSFTFTDLLPIKDGFEGTLFAYQHQQLVDYAYHHTVPTGYPFSFFGNVDRETSPASKFQWFRREGTNEIPLADQPSTGGFRYLVQAPRPEDEGIYFYKIWNDDMEDLVLTSKDMNLYVMAGEQIRFCLEYELNPESNPTLALLAYVPDWDALRDQCIAEAEDRLESVIALATHELLQTWTETFLKRQQTSCIDQVSEEISYSYVPKEYHYTLYYYDQAGNLVQTVPPKGVKPLDISEIGEILGGNAVYPDHELKTQYRYNSRKQLVWQKSPDGGVSRFWYNKAGQLRLSQNAKQAEENEFSYTRYDRQGRVVEVGELESGESELVLNQKIQQLSFPAPQEYLRRDVVWTYYDHVKPREERYFVQENLRGRVSWTATLERDAVDTVFTLYSYDTHGNVKSLEQVLPGIGPKRTDYLYDLISGKVNYVLYQQGRPDQLLHRYTYDSDNRIREVYTSTDAYLWTMDARYYYYPHGPLARVELGEHHVQGLDYYYTLQGWLKGVNMPYAGDPGGDGIGGMRTGGDAFAFTLGYYEGDYAPIGSNAVNPDSKDGLWDRYRDEMGTGLSGLYNGNISWMSTDLPGLGEQNRMQAMVYGYDQLHRIVQARSLTQYGGTGYQSRGTSPQAYDTDYSYDPNGNLLTLQRRNHQGGIESDYKYDYYHGTNRLWHTAAGDGDNYKYDPIGNLVRDKKEGIANIAWTPSGKVREVEKDDNSGVKFRYDASGNRIAKILEGDTTIYVRDASGNVMAIYKNDTLIERPIYGSARLGMVASASAAGYRTLGGKKYELSNHLGNVLAVVRDNIHMDQDSTWSQVAFVTDYYPFGLEMGGRTMQDSSYRYGFNGKENDSKGEWGGQNHYDYGFRIYNPGIGKFLSVDPLAREFPWNSTYAFAEGSPISNLDLDGLEKLDFRTHMAKGIASGNPLAGLVTYQVDWLEDKLIGGTERYIRAGFRYAENERNHQEYRAGSNQHLPANVESMVYNINKVEAAVEITQSAVDILDSNSFLMSQSMGGLQSSIAGSFATRTAHMVRPTSIAAGLGDDAAKTSTTLPRQIHHFATNKSKTFTPRMSEIADEFGLSLNGDWNKQVLPHLGRHPNDYHRFVLRGMENARIGSEGSQAKFLNLFNQYVKEPVIQNPGLLRKSGW